MDYDTPKLWTLWCFCIGSIIYFITYALSSSAKAWLMAITLSMLI